MKRLAIAIKRYRLGKLVQMILEYRWERDLTSQLIKMGPGNRSIIGYIDKDHSQEQPFQVIRSATFYFKITSARAET